MKKKALSYEQRRTLAGLAMSQLRQRLAADPNYKRPETPAEEFARMHREQDEADRRAFEDKTGITELNRNTRALMGQVAEFWRKPIPEIKEFHSSYLVDPFAGLPSTPDGKPLTEADGPKITQAYENFIELEYSRQRAYSADAKNRLLLYVAKHGYEDPTIDATQISCWQAASARLQALGAFGDEAAFVDPEPEAPAPQLDERDALESAWGIQHLEIWGQWLDSLKTGPWKYTMPLAVQQAALDTMARLNLNPMVPDSYNSLRLAMVAAGILPSHLRTGDEILAARLEESDMSNPRARADFVRESNRLRYQPDPTV